MTRYNLLGVGNNAKTVKGDGSEFLTAILYMAPAKQVDGINVCPMAEMAGCAKACLYTAGRGRFNNVQQARMRKTMLWRDDREEFLRLLREDIARFQRYCDKRNIQPCVRLNGTSDIQWEKFGFIQDFPGVTFYDYSKIVKRAYSDLPPNYHLTLSYSEANEEYAERVAMAVADTGRNMAVVFRDKNRIPATFRGFPVLDGDKDDLRFLDKPGHVVALYAKGDAKRDATGFVIG